MTNYSELSDPEINNRVAEALGLAHTFKWSVKMENGDWMSGDSIPNYCNSPNDAWPIILENKIDIEHELSEVATARIYQLNGARDGFDSIYQIDRNPLRAAMIVFLMIKGQDND